MSESYLNELAYTKSEYDEYHNKLKMAEIRIAEKIETYKQQYETKLKERETLTDLLNINEFINDKERIRCVIDKKRICNELEKIQKTMMQYINDSNLTKLQMKKKLSFMKQNLQLSISEFIDKYISMELIENYQKYNNMAHILDIHGKTFVYYTHESVDKFKEIIVEFFGKHE
jgi:hypothetical protein